MYPHEEEGVIYVWNTRRHYDKRGQVMAAVKIEHKNMIVFWDDSRKIDGCFPAKRGDTCEQTMAAYDHGCYRDICVSDPWALLKQLKAATKDFNPHGVREIPLEEDDAGRQDDQESPSDG